VPKQTPTLTTVWEQLLREVALASTVAAEDLEMAVVDLVITVVDPRMVDPHIPHIPVLLKHLLGVVFGPV